MMMGRKRTRTLAHSHTYITRVLVRTRARAYTLRQHVVVYTSACTPPVAAAGRIAAVASSPPPPLRGVRAGLQFAHNIILLLSSLFCLIGYFIITFAFLLFSSPPKKVNARRVFTATVAYVRVHSARGL